MTERNLTDFQIRCEHRLTGALKQVGKSVSGRTLGGQAETYVTGTVSGSDLEFWIYEDGANFKSPLGSRHFENLDFNSQDELAMAFTATLVKAVLS